MSLLKSLRPIAKMKKRCSWANAKNPLYIQYHDKEWGRPLKNDEKLFELLCLEGAQAGLSWETVLNKREGYREVFKNFDPIKCSKLTDKYLEKCLTNEKIIRNRLKVYSVRTNAKAYLEVKKEFGSFSQYIWSFVAGKTILNNYEDLKSLPVKTTISDTMSKDLKKRGFKFIGSTICYAFMQASGMVNDHATYCFRHPKNLKSSGRNKLRNGSIKKTIS